MTTTLSIDNVKRGDYVQIWYDTIAFGTKIVVGIVTKSGPKAFWVRWESGHSKRVLRRMPLGVTPLDDVCCLDARALKGLHG